MNFYKHHIGDYAAATAHLSFIEDAAYSRLLRIYYRDERPLPIEVTVVQRLSGARSREEKEAVATVLSEFFVLEADGWHSKRCDEEVAKATAQAETNARIAAEREVKRRARMEHESLNGSSDEPLGGREPSQTPDSRLQKDQEKSSLRSDSSAASPTDLKPRLTPEEKAQRLAQVTDDATTAYNAKCAKPNGLMPLATRAGRAARQQQVKRCLATARAICQDIFGSELITPAFWDAYFGEVQTSDFHSGRQGGGKGHEGWVPDFEFLTQPKQMLKVFERAQSEDD